MEKKEANELIPESDLRAVDRGAALHHNSYAPPLLDYGVTHEILPPLRVAATPSTTHRRTGEVISHKCCHRPSWSSSSPYDDYEKRRGKNRSGAYHPTRKVGELVEGRSVPEVLLLPLYLLLHTRLAELG